MWIHNFNDFAEETSGWKAFICGTHIVVDLYAFSYMAEKASEISECPICLEIPSNPAVTSCCQKTFCLKCIQRVIKCPLCRGTHGIPVMGGKNNTVVDQQIWDMVNLELAMNSLHIFPVPSGANGSSLTVPGTSLLSIMNRCKGKRGRLRWNC